VKRRKGKKDMAPQINLKGRTLSMLFKEHDRKEGWIQCKEVG
jgi:hypothetical protein